MIFDVNKANYCPIYDFFNHMLCPSWFFGCEKYKLLINISPKLYIRQKPFTPFRVRLFMMN